MIQDPPTSSSEGGSGADNLFLHGLVAGMSEALRNKRFSGIEFVNYDPQSRLLTLAFKEQSGMTPVEPLRELLSHDEKARVPDESENTINSAEGGSEGVRKARPEGSRLEQRGEEVIDVPVIDSGNRVHIIVKEGNDNIDNRSRSKEQGGETLQSTGDVPKDNDVSNQDEVAPLKRQEEQQQGNRVEVEAAHEVIENNKQDGPEIDTSSFNLVHHTDTPVTPDISHQRFKKKSILPELKTMKFTKLTIGVRWSSKKRRIW